MTYRRQFSDPMVGRRVRVIAQGRYGGQCVGQDGTVRAVYDTDSIAVDLDFMANPGSKQGYFYFKSSELELLPTKKANATEKGEKDMTNASKNAHLKPTNYHNIAVVQEVNENDPFEIFECANYEEYLKQGDLCVVAGKGGAMLLVEIVEIKETPATEVFCEVVDVVLTDEYKRRLEVRKEAAELKEKMQKRAKQLQDIVLYQTLAKDDPEMAALLSDFQNLGL